MGMQISIDMWEISFIQLRQWFDSETSLLCAYSREIKCMFTKKINKYKKRKEKELYGKVYCSIDSCQKLGTTQMSVSCKMDKQTVEQYAMQFYSTI